MLHNVLVPHDGSPFAARALGPASALARYLDSEMVVVGYHTTDEDRAELVAGIEESIRLLGDVKHRIVIEPLVTTVAEQLASVINEAPGQLVVMASHGRGRSAAVAGSVATGVLAATSSPLILVGPGYKARSFRCHGPLQIAVTTEEHSTAILPTAAAMANGFDFELEIVTVHPPIDVAELNAEADGDGAVPEETYLRGLAAAVTDVTGDPVAYTVLHGNDPAEAIIYHAGRTKAALLAMATHNPTGVDRLVNGSTTANVLAAAPCPVIALRPSFDH